MDKFPSNELKMESMDVDNLIPYSNHPFQIYEGKKLDELTESIKAQNILSPLIVRPHSNQEGKFEVLAGHNRLVVAKKLKMNKVPTIILYNLKDSDDEALLVVIETNLNQRSFKDLRYSERARAIFMYHNAMKKQLRRSDLTNQADKELDDAHKFRQVGEKLNSDEETALNFELSPRTVSRYLQIYRLSEQLMNRLDNNEFAFDPAISISYLKELEQKHLDEILGDTKENYKLTMRNAKSLREASAKSAEALSKTDIEKIIGKETKTKKEVIASSQEEMSFVVKVLTKLNKIVIPNIIAKYSNIDNPTKNDNKNIIESLRQAVDATIATIDEL